MLVPNQKLLLFNQLNFPSESPRYQSRTILIPNVVHNAKNK
jgi:hypothetical protein